MIPFHKTANHVVLAAAAIMSLTGLAACNPDDNLVDPTQPNPPGFAPIAAANNASLVVLTSSSQLLVSNATGPGAEVRAPVAITGVLTDHTMAAIDFRPADGVLYGISLDPGDGDLQLYTINRFTGVATPVGAESTAAVDTTATALGMDWNPSADLIRVVTDAEDNLTLTSAGVVAAQTDLTPAGAVTAAAYTNNHPGVAGTGNTTLYVIDSTANTLLRQGDVDGTPSAPSTGVLTSVGSLGVNPPADAGFDIDGFAGVAYLGFGTSLYTVNLSTGAATLVGTVSDGSLTVRDIAVTAPTSVLMYGVRNTGPTAELVSFTVTDPSTVTAIATITLNDDRDASVAGVPLATATAPVAVPASAKFVGLDFRPNPVVGTTTLAEGQLFALLQDGSDICLYTIALVESTATTFPDIGVATPFDLYPFDEFDVNSEGVQCAIDTAVHADDDDDPSTDSTDDDGVAGTDTPVPVGPSLTGTAFGFDFNPNADRIRLVTNTSENHRLVPTSGAAVDTNTATAGYQGDSNLTVGSTMPTSAAYTNSYPQQFRTAGVPSSTTLFIIDPTTDMLARQGAAPGTTAACPGDTGNPNCGVTTNIGALGVDFVSDLSFDIVGGSTNGTTNYVNAIGYAVGVLTGDTNSSLYRVNLSTGAATVIGADEAIGSVITAATVQLKR